MVDMATQYFADNYADGQIIPGSEGPVNVTQYLDKGGSGDPFDNDAPEDDQFIGSITSIDDCHTDEYNLLEPLPGAKCEDLMYYAWKNCYNKGRGGSVTARCLKYSFGTYI